jgi:ferrochelatase
VTRRPIDAILLIGFGGPTRREEIRPFLDNVLRGRPVPKERYEEVVHHYEAMGGRSPYNDLTMRQADALGSRLKRDGIEIPVVVGMRNWNPHLVDTIRDLARGRAKNIFGFILAAHRCEASWERYQVAVEDARLEVGEHALHVEYNPPWHTHPKFIEAVAARASEALAQLDPAAPRTPAGVEGNPENRREAGEAVPPALARTPIGVERPLSDRERAAMIFTAHSVPVPMSDASGYADQIRESARLVADNLRRDSWTLAFQSRSGGPRDAWLEPDVGAVLPKFQGRPVVIVPIGFLCDHVEVLYDLDVEAQKIAGDAGVKMVRAGTVGDHPAFIEMMASLVRERAGAK